MQFKPFEPGIEVFWAPRSMPLSRRSGCFLRWRSSNSRATASGTVKGRDVVVDRDAWYPLSNWLAAYESIAKTVGPRALMQIGQQIPKHAPFPPTINDIHSALSSLNAAYHMNHRKRGKVMFDPETGQLTPGIGSYGYTPVPRERKIISVCENPYPCDFDKGLITALANRFEKMSRVVHDDDAPCRRTNAESCTYTISW